LEKEKEYCRVLDKEKFKKSQILLASLITLVPGKSVSELKTNKTRKNIPDSFFSLTKNDDDDDDDDDKKLLTSEDLNEFIRKKNAKCFGDFKEPNINFLDNSDSDGYNGNEEEENEKNPLFNILQLSVPFVFHVNPGRMTTDQFMSDVWDRMKMV
jgi:hypothetical protein